MHIRGRGSKYPFFCVGNLWMAPKTKLSDKKFDFGLFSAPCHDVIQCAGSTVFHAQDLRNSSCSKQGDTIYTSPPCIEKPLWKAAFWPLIKTASVLCCPRKREIWVKSNNYLLCLQLTSPSYSAHP